MYRQHLKLLVCPKTNRALLLKDNSIILEKEQIREGFLIEPISGNEYPIINYIPRFVSSDNYAANFGLEWNIHSKTQYDDYSGMGMSKERFEKETQWDQNLDGEIILECGSGSGRFTKHALETGATVVSFDYSNAVESNFSSNGYHKNLLLVQADIYHMPFPKNFFDKVFCFGVLQHTPNPEKSFKTIVEYINPGGKISSDIYRKYWFSWILPKYLMRQLTTHINPHSLYKYIKNYINIMWPLVKFTRKLPKVGGVIIFNIFLIADYASVMGNSPDNLVKEWAYLDTYDLFSPKFDKPATLSTFKKWYEDVGLINIDIRYGYNGVEGRGVKPKISDETGFF
jgi:SAM-dependent methyltransferase